MSDQKTRYKRAQNGQNSFRRKREGFFDAFVREKTWRALHHRRGIRGGSVCLSSHARALFEGGYGYEFSRGASSSAGIERAEDPVLYKLLTPVAGESVRYAGDRYEALKAQFGAELCFTEEACGVKNYYLYAPRLGGGIRMGEHVINLHIAVSGSQTAVGSPVIFGGI